MRLTAICMALMASAAAGAETTIFNDSIRQNIAEVVVTGTRNTTDVRHLPMTISTVSRKQLTADFRESVLPTVNELVPGLFVTSRGVMGYGVSTGAAGSIKLRGIGSGASMLVLVDGQPQYAGLYGHPIPDACLTMTAERVEVLRGPASLLYGSNAMGGVMNIVTRQAKADGVRTDISLEGGSYGSLHGEVGNEVKAGRFSNAAALSYSRTDGHRPNSQFEQFAGFIRPVWAFNDNWKASGEANVTYFKSSNPGPVSAPLIDNDMKITRGTAALALVNDYDRTSGALRVYYNWGHHNINDGHTADESPQTSLYLHDDVMAGVSLYQSVELFGGNRTTVGFDYQHFGGKAWNRAIEGGAEKVIADKTQDEFAGYVDFRQDITPWLTAGAGLRVDHHSRSGTQLVPQGGLSFRLSSDAEIRAMVSRGFRNPTIKDMYMFNPKNPDLEAESMTNYELSWSQRFVDGRLKAGVNVFYLKADNLITTVFTDGRPLNMNTGKTENSGVEAEMALRASQNLTVNANYSYLHTSAHITGAPEHKLYAGATYTLNRLTLNTGLMYFAGLLTSESTDDTSHAALWHLTASLRVGKALHLYVRGENLLAQKYEINKGFTMPRATVAAGMKLNL